MLRKILSGTLIAVSLAWLSAPSAAMATTVPVVVVSIDGSGNTTLNGSTSLVIDASPTGQLILQNGNAPKGFRIFEGTASVSAFVFSAGPSDMCSSNSNPRFFVVPDSGLTPSPACLATLDPVGTLTVRGVKQDFFLGVAATLTVNTGSGSETESSSPSQPVSLWRAELDPNGGVCADGGTRRDAEWMKMFVGYGYVPGASDCKRPGFTLSGWANVATPDTVRTLPSLIDPSDGKRRFFVAENVDLVAVWEPVVNPPATPSVFVGSLGLFCSDCGVFLLWNAPSDGSSVSVSDPSGAEVCVGATFSLGVWSLCVLPTGVAGTYSLTSQRDGATSLPITTTVA